jgi:hypothetical protein
MKRAIVQALCFLATAACLGVGIPVYAQSQVVNSDSIRDYGLRNLENAVILKVTPETPGPGDAVHFVVESPVYSLTKDSISWYINAKLVASGAGVTSIDATIDSKGTPLKVSVSVADAVWGDASNALIITPIQLDILYDAPSYVPPFYRGRALPSAGGLMRLQAVGRFVQNGTGIPNSSISYTWMRNGRVLGDVSGFGKSSVTIASPALYGSDTISVHAVTRNETMAANASVVIPAATPVLALYEDHPLFGIKYFSALPNETPAFGDATVAAVPYFAPATIINDPTLQFSWTLNGRTINASSSKINELTLTTLSSTDLRVDVTSDTNFFYSSRGDWTFTGSSRNSDISKPSPSDVFHSSQL